MRGSVEPGHIKKYNHSQKKQTVVTDHCFRSAPHGTLLGWFLYDVPWHKF